VGYSSSARRLATVTMAGLGLYLALSVLLYRLRHDCSLLYDPESSYALGGWSRIMDVAYLVRGGLSAAVLLALAHGLPPRCWLGNGA
jgi:cytochrome c-type biogenesis protein CcmE